MKRVLVMPGEEHPARFGHIRDVYEIDKERHVRCVRSALWCPRCRYFQKIKREHVYLDGWSKMDCRRAEDLTDKALIHHFSKADATRGTARYLYFLRQFMNVTYSTTPVRELSDKRLALMHDLYEWTASWRARTAVR
jgi:hypothetical protein